MSEPATKEDLVAHKYSLPHQGLLEKLSTGYTLAHCRRFLMLREEEPHNFPSPLRQDRLHIVLSLTRKGGDEASCKRFFSFTVWEVKTGDAKLPVSHKPYRRAETR